jgi:hypothetical protein
VNGSHGVYRPGGSALNSGQVAGFRAAAYIAHRYADWTVPEAEVRATAQRAAADLLAWVEDCARPQCRPWTEERAELQARMSRAGAHIRAPDVVRKAVAAAWEQWERVSATGDPDNIGESLRNRQLCFAHAVYLEAILHALESGVGSRGSAIALDPEGVPIHDRLDDMWRIALEDERFREKVLETVATLDGEVTHAWVDRRPLPHPDAWFETAWARFREGEIYT